ncbi:armadillo-type protein [Pilobolus umbonatus]|nr:armadillo-type protein [Pilobolus umbonatus]
MGKDKQKRKSSERRINPIGYRITDGIKEGNSSAPITTPEKILPVIEKLTSDDPTNRIWAAACISNLILSNAATRKLMLSKGVVPLLINCLEDSVPEVREESLGTLRNLIAVESTIAKEYYSRHILDKLTPLLSEISGTIDRVVQDAPIIDEEDQHKRSSIWDFTENYISIVWSICEASDDYIKAINRMNIVTFLTSFLLSSDKCPNRVVIAAGQCLNTLTDDNKDIYIEFHNHPEYVQGLLSIVNDASKNPLVQVLACAILLNIKSTVRMSDSWESENNVEMLHKLLIPVLVKALDFDIQSAAVNTVSAIESGKVTSTHDETDDITPKPKQPLTNEEIYVQEVQDKLSIIQLALELLADICIEDDSEDDGYQDMDESMESENEADELPEDNTDDVLAEDSLTNQGTSAAVDVTLDQSNPIVQSYIHQIFPHLIRLSTATPISYRQMKLAPTVSHNLVVTHQRALECLNNFLLAMNEVPSKFWFTVHQADATKLWEWLFSIANDVVNSQPEEWAKDSILEVVVGCLWALGRGLGQNIPLQPTDIPALCGTYNLYKSENMLVKIVGCLGPIAMRQRDINNNKIIGDFIMGILKATKEKKVLLAVVVEALDFMFDVYSDSAFDYDYPVFVQGGYLNSLKQILPHVRSLVKGTDRRKNFDLRMRADEALENLVAFIDYKKKERRH